MKQQIIPSVEMDDGEWDCVGATQVMTQPMSVEPEEGQETESRSVNAVPWGALVELGGRIIELVQSEATVGRVGRPLTLTLTDPRVSALHCILRRESAGTNWAADDSLDSQQAIGASITPPGEDGPVDRWGPSVVTIEALGRNGTFVNGRRVQTGQRVALANGALVTLTQATALPGLAFFVQLREDGSAALDDCPELCENYHVLQTVGSGAFSTVRLGIHRRTGRKVAIKVVDKQKQLSQHKSLEQLQSEVLILRALRHPGVVELLDVFAGARYFYTVMEYCDGGELFDRVLKRTLSEYEARLVTLQLLDALDYLHAHNVTHRDLKPENIMLAKRSLTVKLADFGLANRSDPGQRNMATQCGTPHYVAPEILNPRLSASSRGYDHRVDLWSLGIVLYFMLSGYTPWRHSDDIQAIFKQIVTAEVYFPEVYFGKVSDAALDFIMGLLEVNPERRMTTAAARVHPWLRGVSLPRNGPVCPSMTSKLKKAPVAVQVGAQTKRPALETSSSAAASNVSSKRIRMESATTESLGNLSSGFKGMDLQGSKQT